MQHLQWDGKRKARGEGTVVRSLFHTFLVNMKWNLFTLNLGKPQNSHGVTTPWSIACTFSQEFWFRSDWEALKASCFFNNVIRNTDEACRASVLETWEKMKGTVWTFITIGNIMLLKKEFELLLILFLKWINNIPVGIDPGDSQVNT